MEIQDGLSKVCLAFVILTIYLSTSVNCGEDYTSIDDFDTDRSKNEINEYVTSPDLPNELTTGVPTQGKHHDGHSSSHNGHHGTNGGSKKYKIDAMDQYLLDGILDIVDEKFTTLNMRLMTIERGINDLQYYSIRSFRVVNTHLHAVDTMLHSMQNQLTQNENQNLALEQSVGSVKDEVADLQSISNGLFQAIEQNLGHFHLNMEDRITDVKQSIEQLNFNADLLRNDTTEIRLNVDTLKLGQQNVQQRLNSIENVNSEILKVSNHVLNVSVSVHEASESIAYHTSKTRSSLDMTSRNISTLSRNTDEIRSGISLVLANMSSGYVAPKTAENIKTDPRAYSDMSFENSNSHMSCARMFAILDEKLKNINVTAKSESKSSKECMTGPALDQEDFNNQTSYLMNALETINENIYQSVTLYRHTGSLIERVLSDNEQIAEDQVRLREELLSYLLNGTYDLFNRSMPDFSDFVGKTGDKSRDRSVGENCGVTKQVLEEMGQLSRNGTQLVELLSDLALSSSSTIRNSLVKLDQGVSNLNRLQEDKLNSYLMSKAEAFSRDDKQNLLKDIHNKTDLIYLFAEAIASNTGWIPFVYHRIMFVENQVNKTLGQLANIDASVKEVLVGQRANMAIFFKPKDKKKKDNTPFGDLDNRITPVPESETRDSEQDFAPGSTSPRVHYSNSTSFDSMMQFVYKTNQKFNRLIPALTNLLGEPGK